MKIGTTCVCALAAGCALLLAAIPGRAEARTVEHAVRSGDNLHLIAGYYYRDPRQWRRIWKLNQKSLRSPNRLVPGKTLQVEVVPGAGWEAPYEDFRSRVRGK